MERRSSKATPEDAEATLRERLQSTRRLRSQSPGTLTTQTSTRAMSDADARPEGDVAISDGSVAFQVSPLQLVPPWR
jgi:hypothetical protein